MMESKVFPVGTFPVYKYVVVLSHMDGQYLFSRRKDRDTWETQGGHIEEGETPLEAARRELWEESGALEYDLTPLCDYWAGTRTDSAVGRVYTAQIRKLGPLPAYEMAETRTFPTLPANLTYPGITPVLAAYERER